MSEVKSVKSYHPSHITHYVSPVTHEGVKRTKNLKDCGKAHDPEGSHYDEREISIVRAFSPKINVVRGFSLVRLVGDFNVSRITHYALLNKGGI